MFNFINDNKPLTEEEFLEFKNRVLRAFMVVNPVDVVVFRNTDGNTKETIWIKAVTTKKQFVFFGGKRDVANYLNGIINGFELVLEALK